MPKSSRIPSHLLARARQIPADVDRWTYTQGIRSTRSLTLPHFLGIGAQKAGTTWLDHNMRFHPDLFLPKRKELHYFDREWHTGLRSYARKFAGAGDRVRGEITPAYGVLPLERIRFIHSVMPDVRLIFLMRNPIERAWSHTQMHLLKRRGKRADEVSEKIILRAFQRPGLVKRSSYLTVLDNWLSVYPREQLYIGFFEDVSARPRELLSEVFQHVGVTPDIDWNQIPVEQVVHKGAGSRMPSQYRAILEELFAPEIEGLYQRFGERVAAWRTQPTPLAPDAVPAEVS